MRKPRSRARFRRTSDRAPWSPPVVSLCMIARDEEANIGACLQSASQDVDEIIVVDTGSRDRTRSIARRHGARVLDLPWRDDFSAARNHGLDQAAGEWILVLDCDERIAPESSGLIRQAAESVASNACYLRLINVDPQGKQGADWQAIRMFRRDAGMRYCGRIHERPVFPGDDGAADRPAAPGVAVFHHGYQASAIQQRDKAARNLRLVEKALEEIPEDDLIERSLYLFYRGWGSLAPERDEQIRSWVEFVESHAELERPPVSAWIPSGLAQYAWALSDQRRHVEAEVRARRVLAKYGPSPPLYLAIARSRAEAGDYQAAEEALGVLLDGPDPPMSAVYRHFPLDLGLVRRRARHLQAEVAERHERYDEAAKLYATLVRDEPDHLPSVLRLACVEVQRGRFGEALGTIQRHPRLLEQGLAEIDCLCLALSLAIRSPDHAKWEKRVHDWAPKSEVAARFQNQVDSHPAGAAFELSEFPEIEQGIRVQLPKTR